MPGYGLADWVSALEREGCCPRKSGDGWSARCPSPRRQAPEPDACEGDTQPVVAKCHAGCEFEQVQAALGLDRWDGRPADLQVVDRRPAKNRDRKPRQLPNGPGEQSWIYTDAAGAPLMAAVRRDYTRQGREARQEIRAVDAERRRVDTHRDAEGETEAAVPAARSWPPTPRRASWWSRARSA